MQETEAILAAIRMAIGSPGGNGAAVQLHEPLLGQAELDTVAECIRSGWVSTGGPHIEQFEAQLAAVTGAAHAIACVNGTAALHVALLLMGVEAGDEVMVPAISFVATANAVKYCGAIPHFVDVGEADFGMDPDALESRLSEIAEVRAGALVNRETGRRISAVLPVHVFGYPCQAERIVAIGGRFGLPVIEDSAEALGSRIGSRAAGTIGRLGALSFNGNKIVTTGGGGALLTQDAQLAARARHLTTTAKKPHPWAYDHDMLGYNYRMPSLNAALGLAQLRRFARILERKARLHAAYREALRPLPGVRLIEGSPGASPNHWLNTIVLPEGGGGLLRRLLEQAHAQRMFLRPVWNLLPDLPHLSDCPRSGLGVARNLAERTVCLPSSEFLGAVGT